MSELFRAVPADSREAEDELVCGCGGRIYQGWTGVDSNDFQAACAVCGVHGPFSPTWEAAKRAFGKLVGSPAPPQRMTIWLRRDNGHLHLTTRRGYLDPQTPASGYRGLRVCSARGPDTSWCELDITRILEEL